jgi:hypothetical protein
MSMFAPEQPPASIDLPSEDPGSGDPVQFLNDAIDLMSKYKDADPDAVDKAKAAKIMALIHDLMAAQQQDADSKMTGDLNPRLLRKAGAIA